MFFKYYSLIGVIYVFEFISIYIFSSLVSNIGLLNFFARLIFAFLSVILLRKYVFQKDKYFYSKITFAFLITPLLSSALFSLILLLDLPISYYFIKFPADFLTSFIVYLVLLRQ